MPLKALKRGGSFYKAAIGFFYLLLIFLDLLVPLWSYLQTLKLHWGNRHFPLFGPRFLLWQIKLILTLDNPNLTDLTFSLGISTRKHPFNDWSLLIALKLFFDLDAL